MSERAGTGRTLRWCLVASAASLGLLGIRVAIAPDPELGYMAWNLVLAWIPVALGLGITRGARGGAPAPALVAAALAWILFLPNAPYLLTDLVHLRGREDGLPALDLAMLGAFAFTGLLLFAATLRCVRGAARERLGGAAPRLVVPAAVWLSSAGIYLGRVARWNSWDVLTDPVGRATQAAGHLGDPATLAGAAAFTAAMAACLHLALAAQARVGGPPAHR